MRVRAALSFLTPVGRPTPPSPSALAGFPVVGAAVGLAVGGIWWAGDLVWPVAVAAAVAVVADLALTGMLHLDGLCDTADGLLPPMTATDPVAAAERRLGIMATPEVGAFGLGAGMGALLLRFSVLVSLAPDPLLLGGLWAGSRTAMAVTVAAVPYARPGGLAEAFRAAGPDHLAALAPAAFGTAVATALVLGAAGGPGAVALAALAAAAGGVVVAARRRIGGFTGDVLGAAGVVGETAGLLVAAALA